LLSQNNPVANDDFFKVKLGETVTLNVINNDYHPDNLSFRIFNAGESVSFTDSTITYNIDYEMYYNLYSSDTLVYSYIIIDENGNAGAESSAHVYINIENNYFDFLDHNNIRARIQASGLQFWPGPSQIDNFPVFEFPKGSEKTPSLTQLCGLVALMNQES